MKELLTSFLVLEGFTPVSTNLGNYTIFLKKETGHIAAFFVFETPSGMYVNNEVYHSLKNGALQLLEQKQLGEIHAMFLFLTDMPAPAIDATAKEHSAWIMDTAARTLIIPPDRAEDFYGYRAKLNDFLQDPERAHALLNSVQKNLDRSLEERQRVQKKQSLRGVPIVSIVIAAVNLLVLLLMYYTGDYYVSYLDLDPVAILYRHQWYRFFTYMYVHSGFTHFINNMFMLYIAGSVLEDVIGRVRYVIMYHLLGILAGVGSVIYKVLTASVVPSVGASGAITGVMGILLYFAIRNFKNLKRKGIYWIFVLCMVALDSIYQGFSMKGVDNAAHVSGMIAGVIAGVFIDIAMRSAARKKQNR